MHAHRSMPILLQDTKRKKNQQVRLIKRTFEMIQAKAVNPKEDSR